VLQTRLDPVPLAGAILEPTSTYHRIPTMAGVADARMDKPEALAGENCEGFGVVSHRAMISI
jgi:hypothetical protein